MTPTILIGTKCGSVGRFEIVEDELHAANGEMISEKIVPRYFEGDPIAVLMALKKVTDLYPLMGKSTKEQTPFPLKTATLLGASAIGNTVVLALGLSWATACVLAQLMGVLG